MDDGAAGVGRQTGFVNEVPDKETVTFFGGYPAGRSVGLAEQADVREKCHFVADRGGTHRQVIFCHKRFGPHRLGRVDMLMDDEGEDQFLPTGQLHDCLC